MNIVILIVCLVVAAFVLGMFIGRYKAKKNLRDSYKYYYREEHNDDF